MSSVSNGGPLCFSLSLSKFSVSTEGLIVLRFPLLFFFKIFSLHIFAHNFSATNQPINLKFSYLLGIDLNFVGKKSYIAFFFSHYLFYFRLAEEHSMENPAYNKDHRFSDQFYNTQSSQNEVYSEIQANSVSINSLIF